MTTAAAAFPTLTRKSRSAELDSRSVTPEQKPPIHMPEISEPFTYSPDDIVHEQVLDMNRLEALAFNEEPVKILIHRNTDGLSAKTTDYIAVNGVPAEMLFRNGWVPIGYLPRGVSFITKRKYISVLAASRLENIKANYIERDNQNPENYVERTTVHPVAFSMLEDKNPRGAAWLVSLLDKNGGM